MVILDGKKNEMPVMSRAKKRTLMKASFINLKGKSFWLLVAGCWLLVAGCWFGVMQQQCFNDQ